VIASPDQAGFAAIETCQRGDHTSPVQIGDQADEDPADGKEGATGQGFGLSTAHELKDVTVARAVARMPQSERLKTSQTVCRRHRITPDSARSEIPAFGTTPGAAYKRSARKGESHVRRVYGATSRSAARDRGRPSLSG